MTTPMHIKPYLGKGVVEAYVLDNQDANAKEAFEKMFSLHRRIRMEKLVAEVLLDIDWTPVSPPEEAVEPIMECIRGGRFSDSKATGRKIKYIIYHGGNNEGTGNIKSLTWVVLSFAVLYFLVTLLLMFLVLV